MESDGDEGGTPRLCEVLGGIRIGAYDSIQSHHALRACEVSHQSDYCENMFELFLTNTAHVMLGNMKGYVTNIEQASIENEYFRKVLYTDTRVQLVVMNLKPNEEIGEEVHQLDQFIRIEEGEGKAVLDGEDHVIGDGYAIVVPQGTRHNIINTSGDKPMKLYTVYAPPNHKDGTIHKTKADAEADEAEHFDGRTTEEY
jgi:mannose-6-phosphate isomerase-like protein (cupin superfamily)